MNILTEKGLESISEEEWAKIRRTHNKIVPARRRTAVVTNTGSKRIWVKFKPILMLITIGVALYFAIPAIVRLFF